VTCQYTNLPFSRDPQLSDQCCTVNIQFFISHISFSFRSQIDVTFNRYIVENSGFCKIMLCQWLSCSQCFKCSTIIFKDTAVHEECTDLNPQKQCCEKPKSFKHIFHYISQFHKLDKPMESDVQQLSDKIMSLYIHNKTWQ